MYGRYLPILYNPGLVLLSIPLHVFFFFFPLSWSHFHVWQVLAHRVQPGSTTGHHPRQFQQPLLAGRGIHVCKHECHGFFPLFLVPISVYVRYLHIAYNRGLRGTIPSSFNSLSSLVEVFMRDNNLNGPAPACWASFPNLTTINLGIRVHCPNGTDVECCGGQQPLDDVRLPFCQTGFCAKYCS